DPHGGRPRRRTRPLPHAPANRRADVGSAGPGPATPETPPRKKFEWCDAMNGGLADRVRRRLVSAAREPTPESVATALRDEQHVAGHDTVLALVDRLRRDMLGAGPLEALLALPGLTDVLVNGPADVFIDQGAGLVRTDVEFGTDDEVRALAQRLASRAGRRLDDASPWVDARLPDGTRLHAVLAPVSRPGTVISLRIGAQRRFDLADLSAMLGPRGTQILRSFGRRGRSPAAGAAPGAACRPAPRRCKPVGCRSPARRHSTPRCPCPRFSARHRHLAANRCATTVRSGRPVGDARPTRHPDPALA